MHIDEDREELDISDHNLLNLLIQHHASNTQKTTIKRCHNIKINEETTEHFKDLVKRKIKTLGGDITLEQYESTLSPSPI